MNGYKKKIEIKKMIHFSRLQRWVRLVFILPLLTMHLAWAETSDLGATKNTDLGAIKFDHSKTGFNLTGSHILARCASCHVDGVFKGTPRDCASCHVAGNRMGAESKTSKHVATVAPCERCHQNTGWTPVIFNHVGLAPGSCLTCHNGTAAKGKPSTHVPTNDSCDNCHKTIGWTPLAAGGMPANHLPTTQPCAICHSAGFGLNSGVMNHAGIVSGCATCHNGQVFTGVTPVSRPTNHLPTAMSCETCHSTTNFTTFLLPTSAAMMNHMGIVNNCAQCHNGQVFAGVTPLSKADAVPTHMTTALDCSNCHTSTMTFKVMTLTTPPLGHLPTTQVCSTCHGAGASFLPGVMTHTGISSGCSGCHNGQVFTGVTPVSKPVNHVPTSAPCETCHSASSTAVGGFLITAVPMMNHTGIVGGCTNCHNGQSFYGVAPPLPVSKPATHLPTTLSCETCHTSTISFAGAGMNHVGITSNCALCHSGTTTFAVGMVPVSKASFPAHLVTSAPCEQCHTSTATFSSAAGAVMPANHLPTTQACSLCHSAGFGVNSGVMNHAGIGSGCATCHNGQVFYGVTPVSKPLTHLPTSAACETCHSTTKFTIPGGFGGTAMSHTGITGGCTNCHNGQVFAGVTPVSKPATHVPTTLSCETCHSSTKFTQPGGFMITTLPMMNHTGIANNCAQCHNTGMNFYGVTMVTKLVNHVPTNQPCETCHSTSNFTTFSGTAMNHTGITANCKQCHNDGLPLSFQGVSPVSTSSFPGHAVITGQDCSACHTSTVSFFTQGGVMPTNHIPTTQVCTTCHKTGFGPGSGLPMNHVGIVSGCTTCHNGQVFFGVTPVSKPVNHLPTSQPCETCHLPSQFTQPGGFVTSSMNHTGIVGGCTNCHNGQAFAGITPKSKPATHVPTTLSCESCHSLTNFTTFLLATSPAMMNHTGIASGCATCHNGQSFYGVTPVAKPTTHVPTTLSCESCHSLTNFTTFLLATSPAMMNHTGIASGCATCHNGQIFYGVTPVAKPTTHIPTTLACEICHSPTNFTTFSGTLMNHTGIVNGCATCHDTGKSFIGGIVTKSANHIPYAANLNGGAGMACEFCHSPTVFTAFTTGLVTSTTMHNNTIGNGSGWCKGCHLRGLSWSAPLTTNSLTHNGTGTDCSQSNCHRPTGNVGSSYTTWN